MQVRWSLIVWDEGHVLKSDTTKMYKAAYGIKKAHSRIILTGTPIQNELEELWSLLNVVTNGRFNVSRPDFSIIEFHVRYFLGSGIF